MTALDGLDLILPRNWLHDVSDLFRSYNFGLISEEDLLFNIAHLELGHSSSGKVHRGVWRIDARNPFTMRALCGAEIQADGYYDSSDITCLNCQRMDERAALLDVYGMQSAIVSSYKHKTRKGKIYPWSADERDGGVRRIKTSRNAPCPCSSGRKYKHCCMKEER